ncbi:MAG: HlyD family efflux transporter periplasmic adaptor subunit [bacterium]|nr:HlyD family efflux transporter periplasmic adaptor subunit [bacterium]
MQVPRKDESSPGGVPNSSPGPQPAPEPAVAPGRKRWWLVVVIAAVVAGGLYLALSSPQTAPEAGVAVVAEIPTVTLDVRPLAQSVRLTGTTQAERYASVVVPRLRGSRRDRGRSARGNLIQANSNISVRSTSTVSTSSTSSSLSQTGLVASTGNTGGGGFSGGARSGSAALQASTTRVGGGGGSSGGNVTTVQAAGAGAMGASGLGSTSTSLSGGSSGPPSIGGGGGGGRRRGDFTMSLQKLVGAGEQVRKGEIIAEFDRQYMLQRLEDYQASVAQTKASYDKGKADLEVTRDAHNQSIKAARGSLDKAKLDIKATPVLSAIDGERLKLAHEEAEAEYKQLLSEVKFVDVSEKSQVRMADLEVQQSNVEYERASNNVDKLLVKAPIDGMLVRLNVFRGGEFGQVQEGDELHPGMGFLRIVDTSSMVLDGKVNQVEVEKLRIGQKAKVRFDAFPDLELMARVYSIGTVAKARQFRREYVTEVPVKVKLTEMDPRVIPDLSASVDVVVAEEPESTVAPLEAIFTDESGESSFVYVKRGTDWEKREVVLGVKNHVAAVIRSGVSAGEEIALERPE